MHRHELFQANQTQLKSANIKEGEAFPVKIVSILGPR